MKKENYLFAIVAISMALTFTACSSSDDSDSGGNESEIAPPISIPSNLEAVDLGLPSGTKWANMNVGAYSPEEYGLFFAWGETTGYSSSYTDHSFDWTSYKFSPSSSTSSTFKKYNPGNDIMLEAEDDAATANWGSAWKMPTQAQWQELKSNCYWEYAASYNGIAGFIVYEAKNAAHKGKMKDRSGTVLDMSTWDVDTSFSGSYTTNDTHIFLPAAGYRHESNLTLQGSFGYYWSSELDDERSSFSYNAWHLYFKSGGFVDADHSTNRWYGQSVRAVCAQ